MGRQCIEIEIEPVTGEERETAWSQEFSQGVDDAMGHMLCSGTQMEDRKNLRAGINDQPEPEHVLRAAQPGAQFIQLQMREPEMAEEAFVQGLSVLTSPGQPGRDGRLPVAEDPLGGGKVQSFGQRSQHDCDLVGGSFQAVQGSMVASREGGAAGLTTKRLDALGMTMHAIANKRVDLIIGDAEVEALRVGTGVALGVHALGSSPPAFHLAPGTQRSRHWPSN